MKTQWLWVGGLSLALFIVAGCKQKGSAGLAGPDKKATVSAKAQTTCPVMGGAINKSIYADHDGKRVYFCCPGCGPAFKKDPEKYIKKLEDEGVTLDKAPAGKLWTCSMHPHVKQAKPGKCPICEMDLVPAPSKGEAAPHGSGGMQHH